MSTESELEYERKRLTGAVSGMVTSRNIWELSDHKDDAERCIRNIFVLVKKRIEP